MTRQVVKRYIEGCLRGVLEGISICIDGLSTAVAPLPAGGHHPVHRGPEWKRKAGGRLNVPSAWLPSWHTDILMASAPLVLRPLDPDWNFQHGLSGLQTLLPAALSLQTVDGSSPTSTIK